MDGLTTLSQGKALGLRLKEVVVVVLLVELRAGGGRHIAYFDIFCKGEYFRKRVTNSSSA